MLRYGGVAKHQHTGKLESSTRTKPMPVLWADSVISKINECVYAPKDKYKNAHSSPIQNNQKLQTTQMSTEVRIGKKLSATHELRCIQQ